MLEQFLISKKEIGKLKVTLKRPLDLSCEKIIQTPRSFNTTQIKSAIENISFIDIEESIIPDLLTKTTEYILKDFFLYMHQSGLYNRQFKLWTTLASVTSILFFRLQKGFLNKKDLGVYITDFFIDVKRPCMSAIIEEISEQADYNNFKVYLSKVLSTGNLNRLKGIFYFLSNEPDNNFREKLLSATYSLDQIAKYESIIRGTKNTSLNVILYKKRNETYIYEPIYPDLKLIKDLELQEIKNQQ